MFLRSGIESVSKVWFHLLDWLLPDHSYDHLGPDFGTNEVLITYSRRLIATRGSFMLLVISVFFFSFFSIPHFCFSVLPLEWHLLVSLWETVILCDLPTTLQL